MGDVVGLGAERQRAPLACSAQGNADVVGGAAPRSAVGLFCRRCEPALEVAPGDAVGVHQVAYVAVGTAQLDLFAIGAVVAERLCVADNGALPAAGIVDHLPGGERLAAGHELSCHSMGLTGYQ